jgi:hypothetical protein
VCSTAPDHDRTAPFVRQAVPRRAPAGVDRELADDHVPTIRIDASHRAWFGANTQVLEALANVSLGPPPVLHPGAYTLPYVVVLLLFLATACGVAVAMIAL